MRTFILVMSLMAPLVAQQTVVVSGGGSALKDAIGRASPGDTMIVNPGIYDFFTSSIGVRVLCNQNVELRSSAPLDALKITSLPAGQSFVLVGARIGNASTLTIENCKGDVSFSQLTGPESLYLIVRASASVSFHRCRLSRTFLHSTKALFSNCLFTSAEGVGAVFWGRLCEVDFNNSVVLAIALPGARVSTPALMEGSFFRLSGHSRLETSPLHSGVPALIATASTVTLSPSVVLTSGAPTPIRRNASSVVTESIPGCSVVFVRIYLQIAVDGDPQLPTALFFSGVSRPRPVTLFGGQLWFDATVHASIALSLPASGAWVSQIAVPPGLPRGLLLTTQALSLGKKVLIGGAARAVLN